MTCLRFFIYLLSQVAQIFPKGLSKDGEIENLIPTQESQSEIQAVFV